MNILVLSCKQDNNDYYPQDKEIIASLKKADGLVVESMLYDEEAVNKLKKEDAAVVFNLCDSFADGTKEAQLVESLEKKHIPVTGNGSQALYLCMDKPAVKTALQQAHLPVPFFFAVHSNDAPLPEIIPFPVIIKPAHEHGSVGIDEDAVAGDKERFTKKVAKLLGELKQTLLVEQYIEGREYCIPLIGNGHPTVLPVLEIDYSEHFEDKAKILSYKAKWSKNSNAFKNTYSRIAHLSDDFKARLEAVAKGAYKALGMKGYGTVDVRVDSFGNIYIIDVNCNSYLAPESDLAKAAAHVDIPYPALLKRITHYAVS